MPVEPSLLAQALRTPETADVTATPIVRAVILSDPANAEDLVPPLRRADSLEARNARRILCEFGPEATPHLMGALAVTDDVRARVEGIEVFAALLTMEEPRVVRSSLADCADHIRVLLGDRRPMPTDVPDHVEVDFTGRVCDLLYVAIRELVDERYDQSTYRSLDDQERDAEIDLWLSHGTGGTIA